MSLLLGLVLWTGTALAVEVDRAPSAPTRVQRVIPDSVRFDQKVQVGNAIAMTMSNYGFYGNNFISRQASFEYPANSGYEHMLRGGLWVGALALDQNGPFVGVTTGAVDAGQGPLSSDASEWTPADSSILQRSTLPTSAYYDPLHAISELDFVSIFNDLSPVTISGSPEPHRSMNLEVRHESYQWRVAEDQDILFLHIRVTNRGLLLRNAWVGLYTELKSGCKACYRNWPPSSADPSGEGSWFMRTWLVPDDSLGLLREHYCRGFSPPPGDSLTGCNLGHVPYWVGLMYLGARGLAGDTTTRQRTLSAWSWSPGSPFRDQDAERYGLMSTGVIQPLDGDSLQPVTGDPIELLSVGPFPRIDPDSSITVDFAFVGGAMVDDIQEHARAARRLYERRYDLPTAALVSLVSTHAEPGLVQLRWQAAVVRTAVTVYRREESGPWRVTGRITPDGTGALSFEDHDVRTGLRYGYRLGVVEGGAERIYGETWVDVPAALGFGLVGARPNPGLSGSLKVSFTLGSPERAQLELLDLSGRRVLTREVGSLGIGSHTLALGASDAIPAGAYFIRLTQGSRSISKKAVVFR